MEIKRVLNLSDEEFEILINAGKLLGSLRDSKKADEYDELSDGVKSILEGLREVLNTLIK